MTAPISQPQSYTQRYLNFADNLSDKIHKAARAGIRFIKNYPKQTISVVGLAALAILAAVWAGPKAVLTGFTFVVCVAYTAAWPLVIALIGTRLPGVGLEEDTRRSELYSQIVFAVYVVSIPILWAVWVKSFT